MGGTPNADVSLTRHTFLNHRFDAELGDCSGVDNEEGVLITLLGIVGVATADVELSNMWIVLRAALPGVSNGMHRIGLPVASSWERYMESCSVSRTSMYGDHESNAKLKPFQCTRNSYAFMDLVLPERLR